MRVTSLLHQVVLELATEGEGARLGVAGRDFEGHLGAGATSFKIAVADDSSPGLQG